MNMIILMGMSPGWLLIILIVVVLMFGGKKIPELMRGLGTGIREFKEGMSGEEKKKEENNTGAEEKK
ncbi:MAG: twin-arginine translocase TatA/TatE family subunit [Bacteroidetes bacterium]|nr:twin-arginine translocase TatA/TatE family subunit [Bacteroidota bacterium]